jgi:capsular polysaccharide biosynthesis protein
MAQIVVGALNLKNHYNVLSNLSAVGRLRSGLSVSSSKEGWISVTIRDKDPQMAASIANCYVSHLDSLNRELKISLLKPFVTVLDSAIPPTSPSSPRVRLSIVISGIFSLSLGILFAFFLNYIESLKK